MSNKKFQFRLESVRRIEQQVERMAEIELLSAKQQLESETIKLSDLERKLSETFRQLEQACNVDVYFDTQQTFIRQIESQMIQQRERIDAAQKVYQSASIKKLKQAQRVESLDKLRDEDHQDYQTGVANMEQQTILDSVLRPKPGLSHHLKSATSPQQIQ